MRKSKVITATLLAISIALSSGCSNMNKQQMGTMIGGGAGALAGSFFGKGTGKIVATLAGGLIGGVAGNYIGKSLDERDKQDLALATQKALSTAQPNTVTQWRSPTSGATAAIKVGPVYQKSEVVEVKRLATVQPAKNLQMIQAPYVTVKTSNVRNAPAANAVKVASLNPGIEFTAIGATGDWILVGRKGVNVGYIHKSLVEPVVAQKTPEAPAPIVAKAATKAEPVKAVETPPVASAKLDEINVAQSAETKALDEAPPAAPAPVAEKVVASTDCRDMTAAVTDKDGAKESSTSTACKKPMGAWANI